MVSEQLEYLFDRNGYHKVPSNFPEFMFYYRREYQGVIVIHVIDHRPGVLVSEEQFVHLKRKILEFMHERGEQEVHLLSLILTADTQKDRQLSANDSFCWMIDTKSNRLIIHENQAGDFYGWKGLLEEFLLHSDESIGEQRGCRNDQTFEEGNRDASSAASGNAPYGQSRGVSDSNASRRTLAGLPWDRAKIKGLPWVTICLVVSNVILFMICTFTGRMLYNKGALGVMMVIEDRSFYRILTSMFLHTDSGHLFSNMIVLYYVGEIVEKRIGHLPYAVLYFLSGIAGSIVSMGYELLSGDYISSVGASGAVFGVEGALLLLVILHRGRMESVTIGRMVFVIAFSLYCGFTSTDVNNAAHIGGVLMGFALAACFCMLHPYFRTGKDEGINEN